MHFWMSGGEAAALSVVRDRVLDQGVGSEDAPVAGGGGTDSYRQAFVDLDPEVLAGDTMVAVFSQSAELRAMVDENAPGRERNLAPAMVINGEAATQIMGDWAKGEFTNAGLVAGEDFACIPVPQSQGDVFVYLANSLSFFDQPDPEPAQAQEALARTIMGPAVQLAFNASDETNNAEPTFVGTHAAGVAIVGAATDYVAEFFNSDMSPDDPAQDLVQAIDRTG